MKQEIKWGAATALAVAAAIGISSQPGSRTRETVSPGAALRRTAAESQGTHRHIRDACSNLVDLFQAFLLRDISAPPICYESGHQAVRAETNKSNELNFQPKFVIAMLPDPLHTHFSLLFDRFVEAIQQAAQDEGYEYDSSWLPWEMEQPTLITLQDQDEADERKKRREEQPGVLLFHLSPQKGIAAKALYQKGLVVLVIGEEPTDGIHRKQFQNAMQWIAALEEAGQKPSPVAVLGPSFSGSFTSLAELLVKHEVHQDFHARAESSQNQLAIYSGSVTDNQAAEWFSSVAASGLKDLGISFHSFLQDDDTALRRLCTYLQGPYGDAFDFTRLAILSEDETAYGYGGPSATCKGAPRLYYPRDISRLRAAYQKQSIFNSGSDSQSAQNPAQPRSLRSDLADPEGKEHDTVPTYAGNQTPLSEEAQLLGIVAALRSHQSEYIVLRSSNTLDPLFLANFLRREYPEGRVVILNADLLYQRGQDAMALGGVMTLSTYPLFPAEREWTALTRRSPVLAHRVFPESSSEGTYIALRLLLRSPTLGEDTSHTNCQFDGDHPDTFLPSMTCDARGLNVAIPDYAPPFWVDALDCGLSSDTHACKPATWLSVVKRNSSWPLAALSKDDVWSLDQSRHARNFPNSSQTQGTVGRYWPSMPLSMKLFWTFLLAFAMFHLACCSLASFTAKPAFRAHFATSGSRHNLLIFLGSFLVALSALIAGWGCGAFAWADSPVNNPWNILVLVIFVWFAAGLSVIANAIVTRRLNEDELNRHRASHSDLRFQRWLGFLALSFVLSLGLAAYAWIFPLDKALNLANRVPAYWRSVNLTSGVSPLVPFLLMLFGLYSWFWYALHGLALFGPDRPRLPLRSDLIIKAADSKNNRAGNELDVLPMFSHEYAAKPTEDAATPLASRIFLFIVILFITQIGFVILVLREVPVRSLGGRVYAIIFCLWLDFCFSLVIAAGWQLWRTWSRLRQLLVFLDRLPLRRTLAALRGFSWGTVWRMSGNVLDVRYKLLSRQLESLNHLHISLENFLKTDARGESHELEKLQTSLAIVEKCQKAGITFAKWYSVSYDKPTASGLRTFETFQQHIAATSGHILTNLLIPSWRKETKSLILTSDPRDDQSSNNREESREQGPPGSTQEHIRIAEELTSLTYLGFVQNILGRVRTIVLGGLFLFLSATLAVTSYPFDPRTLLSCVLLLLFVVFGAVIVFVYADMHRDATLSHITNTKPGELGSEFWFKIIAFGAAPLLGLITAIFPELSGFLFSWLQPGLTSLK